MGRCWFTCKIVKVSKNSFQVQYNDSDNVEAWGKLEEWVSASRLADPDRLSLRHSGRLTFRPCPPKEPTSHFFEVGASVEAWWKNGWWESFVFTGVSFSSNDSYHVFLPGEGRFLTLHRKDLRAAKDWIGNSWVAVKPHPDILSYVCLAAKHRDE
ncbi:Agenet domain-containing protein [Heracleum sosnowskyi]|uniref:Agenet domain-containing protein n=1 Tax=Heracleum sosnowskyi TaxID=360622 RepID=A0AAD8JDL0_9APIA|nr:Agenet domain-containing protein [Heracleum sosnowskyi]